MKNILEFVVKHKLKQNLNDLPFEYKNIKINIFNDKADKNWNDLPKHLKSAFCKEICVFIDDLKNHTNVISRLAFVISEPHVDEDTGDLVTAAKFLIYDVTGYAPFSMYVYEDYYFIINRIIPDKSMTISELIKKIS